MNADVDVELDVDAEVDVELDVDAEVDMELDVKMWLVGRLTLIRSNIFLLTSERV
jgi:hypothetical protein